MLSSRTATIADAPAITNIYNEGIADRIATFETEPRAVSQIEQWFGSLPIVVVTEESGEVIGFAAAFSYTDRCCYAGIAEFSVYVGQGSRGRGAGQVAMNALIDAARQHGLWKLMSRIFPENVASLTLMDRSGFQRIGIHQKHGKLDGVWRDCVIVEYLIAENIR